MSNDRGDHRSHSWPWPELDAIVTAPTRIRLLLDHARQSLEVTVPPGATEPETEGRR